MLPESDARETVEQQTTLALTRLLFAGTYAELGHLIGALADLVREVKGSLEFVRITLTERDQTVTVSHLGDLNQITDRDVRRLRRLSISLGGRHDGPALSLYISGRTATGDATGPDESSVRRLRSAANDLLRDRGRSPHWLTWRQLLGAGYALVVCAYALQVVTAPPVSLALLGVGCLLFAGPLYLPDVELLAPDQKTRWSRWSRYILGLVVAWLIGSLAVPFVTS